MLDLILIIVAFFIGSIPIGYLVGRAHGVDVRSVGSGNVGATNLGRSVGKKAGAITLAGDVLKGIAAYCLGYFSASPEIIAPVAGFMAICGHCFSPFLRFKGGKGVATSLGVFLFIAPLETAASLVLFVLVFRVWGYVSLSSISTAIALAIIIAARVPPFSELTALVSLLTAMLIVWRHRTNMMRIIQQTEPRKQWG